MDPYRVVDPTDVLWKRCGAWMIDSIAGTAVTLFSFFLIRALAGSATASVLTLLITIGYWFFVNVLLQGTRGYTPGKRLCGLMVVDAAGRPCGTHAALQRSLLWTLDGFPYVAPIAAFGAVMSSRRNQRIGDRFAGTFVVDEQFVGSPPVAVAIPTDPGSGLLPYQLETSAAYLPPDLDILELKRLRDERPAAPSIPAVPALGQAWEPRWDPGREAYVRWNAVTSEWVLFDEDQHQWVKV